MDYRHLETLVTLAETLHFGRAAVRLGVSQPTISLLLRDLERELGTTLVARTRRSVQLTTAGHQFLIYARRSLEARDAAVTAARRAGAGEIGKLVLGLNTMSGLSRLPATIRRFRKAFPLVQLQLVSDGTRALLGAVREGRCDLAFTILPGDVRPLTCVPLVVEPLVAVVPISHPLARRSKVSARQFANEPMIHLPREEEPTLHDTYERIARQAGGAPDVVLETAQLETMLACVAAGLGISFVPASIRRLRFAGVKYVDIVPPILSGVHIVWDARTLPPAGARFLELLGVSAPSGGRSAR